MTIHVESGDEYVVFSREEDDEDGFYQEAIEVTPDLFEEDGPGVSLRMTQENIGEMRISMPLEEAAAFFEAGLALVGRIRARNLVKVDV